MAIQPLGRAHTGSLESIPEDRVLYGAPSVPDGTPPVPYGKSVPLRDASAGPPGAPLPSMPTPLPQPPSHISNQPLQHRVAQVDVFVDDFIGIAQGSKRQLSNLRRNILHSIDLVLDQPRPGERLRNEAASVKKLLKGDGSWETRKLILGWIIAIASDCPPSPFSVLTVLLLEEETQ